MSCATSLGWETIATWLDGISTVVAPMREANSRSASGESLILGGDQVPRRQRLPGRDAHRFFKYGHGDRLLHGVEHLCLDRVDVAAEMANEVVLGQPAEALLVGGQVRERRGDRSPRQQPAERLALVKAERRDVHQAATLGASEPRAVMTWPP